MTMRRRLNRVAGAALLLAACLASPLTASADPEADAAKAFDEGRKLFEQKKDAPAALPLFQQAVDQTGSPNARLYLARCLRDVGKTARAYDEMARTVRDARDRAEKDERYVATRDAAAAELALLEGKVGHLVITLDSTLKNARVSLDGLAIASGELGKPLTVMPGEVRVVADAADGTQLTRTVFIKAAGTETVTLAREGSAVIGPVKQPEEPPRDDGGGGFGVVRGVGIGVAAVGLGGIALLAVGTVKAGDDFAALEQACGSGPCAASYQDVIDSGKTWETVSFVGLGVGIAGVLAGTAMMIWGGPSEPEKAAFQPTADGFSIRF
jgi:hypothetical protein